MKLCNEVVNLDIFLSGFPFTDTGNQESREREKNLGKRRFCSTVGFSFCCQICFLYGRQYLKFSYFSGNFLSFEIAMFQDSVYVTIVINVYYNIYQNYFNSLLISELWMYCQFFLIFRIKTIHLFTNPYLRLARFVLI